MQTPKIMLIEGLKSKIITSGRKGNKAHLDPLVEYILAVLEKRPLINKDILVVTSKVVSVTQGRVKRISTQREFDRLVEKEADAVIGKSQVTLTVKNNIFIPWAGIDRSNVQSGYAVLWPKNPFKTALLIQKELKRRYRLRDLGIIISDSHCVPLRKGVVGLALGYAGFIGVNDLRGRKDLYGNKLKVTQQNAADMLASAAHLMMGEADEKMPFALIRNAPVKFTNVKISPREPVIKKDKCLFSPLY